MIFSKHFVFAGALSALALVACAGSSTEDGETASGVANLSVGRQPRDNTDATKVTSCHGTEPFWSLTIDSANVSFERDGEPKMSIPKRPPTAAAGFSPNFAALYQGRTHENRDRFMNVIISNASGSCSNGMSDELFPFTVSVLSGSELHIGCCK